MNSGAQSPRAVAECGACHDSDDEPECGATNKRSRQVESSTALACFNAFRVCAGKYLSLEDYEAGFDALLFRSHVGLFTPKSKKTSRDTVLLMDF